MRGLEKSLKISLALFIALLFALPPALPLAFAYPSPGTLVHTTYFSQNCASGIGVGITYDGSNLWVSCYHSNPDLMKADPMTGTVIATYNIEGGLGALAYDAVKNGIWAGPAGGSLGDNIVFIPLDASHDVSGPATVAFSVPDPYGIDDGLALDATTNYLYYSPDVSTTITVYTETGTIVTSFGWSGSSCFNSGLGLGGNLLFEGSDGCSHVWVVDKNTQAPSFNFATGGTRDESLTCDPNTFAPVQVMWSKEAYNPNHAFAFAIPAGTCGSGGLPPPSGVPQFPISATLLSAITFAGLALFLKFARPKYLPAPR